MTHRTNCESLVDRGARPCTCTPAPPSAGLKSRFATLLNDLDAMQLAVPYAARWSVLLEAESVIVRLESDNNSLAQRLREVEQERDDAEKRADRLFQDRHDLLATKTTEGLSAAEWQMRTAAAERRLREVEDRLSTVIRVSQEYAGEAAQAQRRVAQLEAQGRP